MAKQNWIRSETLEGTGGAALATAGQIKELASRSSPNWDEFLETLGVQI